VTVHRDKFLTIKPTRRTNFSNLLWNETLHVSDHSSVHHQEFFTVHSAMVYVIQVCRILILLTSYPQTCMTYTIAVCTVKNSWWWTEGLSETCRFSCQHKFQKLEHLAGFIVRNNRYVFTIFKKGSYKNTYILSNWRLSVTFIHL